MDIDYSRIFTMPIAVRSFLAGVALFLSMVGVSLSANVSHTTAIKSDTLKVAKVTRSGKTAIDRAKKTRYSKRVVKPSGKHSKAARKKTRLRSASLQGPPSSRATILARAAALAPPAVTASVPEVVSMATTPAQGDALKKRQLSALLNLEKDNLLKEHQASVLAVN